MEFESCDHYYSGCCSSSVPRRRFYEENIVTEHAVTREPQQQTAATVVERAAYRRSDEGKIAECDIKRTKRNAPDPINWHQQLSVDQINVLHNLGNLIKYDFVNSNTLRTRNALKDFGIKTKIPHKVVKTAISYSKMYPIDFLQKIKEYLSDTANKVSKISVAAELLNYTFDERLVLSGIVHLGLPSLFLKLEFCLTAPIPENQIKYSDKRIISPKKNSESFYSCEKICDGNKPINSYKSNEKDQRIINKLKEQKQKQTNSILNVELYRPTHPLDALFVKLPLSVASTGGQKSNDPVKSNGKDEINDDIKPENNVKLDISSNIPEVINMNGKSDNNGNVTNNTTAVIAEDNTNVFETSFNKQEKQRASNHFDDFTRFPSFASNLTDFSSINLSDLHYLNDPLRNSFKRSVSFKYEYDSVEEESDVEEAIQDEDFSFLIDYDQEKIEDCENFITHLSSREFEDLFESRLDMDVSNDQSTDTLDNINEKSSQIIEKSSMAKIMDNQSKIEGEIIRMFNREINAFPNYRLHTLCVKTTSQTSATGQANDNGKSNVCNTLSLDNNMPDRLLQVEELDIKHEETDQIQIKPHIYDEILATVRKLPTQNQLILFLKFLAILGDPIASLPKVTELEVIGRWFKTHSNSHKLPLTPKIKAEQLNTLDKSCRGFQRPETLADMSIPPKPCSEEKHGGGVLCGHRI